MKNYYEIQLPMLDNRERDMTAARNKWQRAALAIAGGFSMLPQIRGTWQGAERAYEEVMQPYHIACSAAEFGRLVETAFELFPDQEAIFTAELGRADIRAKAKKEDVA